jgi:hypothetical protein
MSTDAPLTRWQRLALLLIFVLAFILRFGGLDHDLHEGQIYHPDTPKQIRAVERFLDNHYYIHYGDLDYDAYPYFNSHLIEYMIRGATVVHHAGQQLIGLPDKPLRPDFYDLFWLTRIWNALLATLLVLVVFQLGRENWDKRAGFAAALLLAVSPADATCAHFAGADTTAGFFATCAVFFAFRIYRHGRWRDYALAALCVAFGFSTKYHAGMALLPVLAAHGLRTGSWRALFQGPALLRLGWLAAVGIPATFLSTPTLIYHFSETVDNIWRFFSQISSYRGVDESTRFGGLAIKLKFAMSRNLPILVWILSPLVVLGVLLGLKDLLRRRPEPRALILFIMPLFYFFVGVSLRPMAHPIYHTLMTPLVFVIAAVIFTRPFGQPDHDRRWLGVLRFSALAASVVILFASAAKETFYFYRQDVSRIARAWAEENVPAQFGIIADHYSFESQKFNAAETNAVGLAWAATRSADPPPAFRLVKTFSLEKDRMAVFRNIPIRFYMNSNAWLRPHFQLPLFQRAPSQSGNEVICDNGVEFLRSEKRLALGPSAWPTVRWLVRPEALPRAWLAVRNGSAPNWIEFSFGGQHFSQALAPGAVAWWPVEQPRAHWVRELGHHWYAWNARACYGPATALLATQPEDLGAFLYHAGRSAESTPLLAQAATATRRPALAALALRAGATARDQLAPLAAPLADAHDDASFLKLCGITPTYLNALDFLAFSAAECTAVATTNQPPRILTPFSQLDAGAYTLNLRVLHTERTAVPLRWRVTALDLASNAWFTAESAPVTSDSRDFMCVPITFQVSPGIPEVRLDVRPVEPTGYRFDGLEIKPDVLATVQWLLQAPPLTPPPVPATVAGVTHKVDTTFKGGVRYHGLQTSAASVRRGGSIGVNFDFGFDRPDLDLFNLVVYVHFVNAAGVTVFQGDYCLAELLSLKAPRVAEPLAWRQIIAVPASAAPGAYTIRTGLYYLDTLDRLRVVSSPYPVKVKAVHLPAGLRITE